MCFLHEIRIISILFKTRCMFPNFEQYLAYSDGRTVKMGVKLFTFLFIIGVIIAVVSGKILLNSYVTKIKITTFSTIEVMLDVMHILKAVYAH